MLFKVWAPVTRECPWEWHLSHLFYGRIFLCHNPKNLVLLDRDRFIHSEGLGSMLLNSLLYLTGYNLSLNEIKNFRQWQSKTPGHPEYGMTPGVETTAGPFGQ